MSSQISSTLALLVVLGAALILPVINAHDHPIDYLKPQNAAREEVGIGPLIWDENLVIYAQDYLNTLLHDCELVHSGGPYGENLAWGSGDLSAMDAVTMWVDEKQCYDYEANSCATDQACGHYTQVVWRDSLRVGCAKFTCNTGGTIVGCNYDPPGNYVGERPY
ncbi:pathogenesis-related protein 1-like [Euphorbia lathyris]|uniref:pathogenesis-related protein 1-like n=1 Tax=Euphorbia lathyris TaxID=212925 RepID=UPI003313DB5F